MMVNVSGPSSTHIGKLGFARFGHEQRGAPEFARTLADEVMEEGRAGERRAQRQHAQRHQHRQRRFMDLFQLGRMMFVMRSCEPPC